MSFPEHERSTLLRTPGIGPGVIRQLEAAGIDSMRLLRSVTANGAVECICARIGKPGWANRRKALMRAMASATER